jgi:HK97 family phage portal protein
MFGFFNTSTKGISGLDERLWTGIGDTDDGSLTAQQAYARVAYAYRAVNIRSNAMSSLPFALLRGKNELDKEGDEYIALANQIKWWLRIIEADLCIFGAAYMAIERNQFRRNPTPRPLLPSTIQPIYDTGTGEVSYFQRSGTYGKPVRIETDDMLWWWLYSHQYENTPGTSPLAVCLNSASTLHNLTRFAQEYFHRGALLPTLFFFGDGSSGLPSTTTDKELNRFEDYMRRVAGGIRNAWRFLALRGNVTAHQIGTPPRDIAASELTETARQDVAVAFGVPMSLLNSDATTYAAASADMFHIYDLVIIPEAENLILPVLQRWLDMVGLKLKWQPELLESYQSYQLQQAQAVQAMVGEPVLTLDEGRALLGYGPMERLPVYVSGVDEEDVEADEVDAMRAWKMAYDAAWSDYP